MFKVSVYNHALN